MKLGMREGSVRSDESGPDGSNVLKATIRMNRSWVYICPAGALQID